MPWDDDAMGGGVGGMGRGAEAGYVRSWTKPTLASAAETVRSTRRLGWRWRHGRSKRNRGGAEASQMRPRAKTAPPCYSTGLALLRSVALPAKRVAAAALASWSSTAATSVASRSSHAVTATLCVCASVLCATKKKEEEDNKGKIVFSQPLHSLTGQR